MCLVCGVVVWLLLFANVLFWCGVGLVCACVFVCVWLLCLWLRLRVNCVWCWLCVVFGFVCGAVCGLLFDVGLLVFVLSVW